MSRKTCARCPEPAENLGARYCAVHRQEHGRDLAAELKAVLVDHRQNVQTARQRAAARIPETCGHRPSDLVVIDRAYYCGVCARGPQQQDKP